jgi:transcriptional regulator NrdR family protein
MKKIKLSILFLFIISLTLNAQTVKSYSGNYDLKCYEAKAIPIHLLSGKATYTYYENADYERIRKGRFSYTGKVSNNGISVNSNISGNYKENLKQGTWKTTAKVVNRQGSATLRSVVNYSDGLPNGLWSFTSTTNKASESGSLNFINNRVIGDFKYKTKGTQINGKSDQKGFIDGIVKFVERGTEEIYTYDHGFLVKYIMRDIQSGDIRENYAADPKELENYQKINQLIESNQMEALEELTFTVEEKTNESIFNKFNEIFTNINYGDALPGDLSYPDNKYIWDAMKVKVIVRQESKSERLERERQEKAEADRIEKERIEKEQYKELASTLAQKIKDVDSKYLVIDNLASAALGSDVYKKKKKHLYLAYKKLLNSYIEKFDALKDFNQQLALGSNALSLCDKMIELLPQETKALEKTLKKTESLEDIEALIK